MTRYLVVYNKETVINAEDCAPLGMDEGKTFADYIEKMNPQGQNKSIEGSEVWVLPNYYCNSLQCSYEATVCKLLTLEEYREIQFHEPEI